MNILFMGTPEIATLSLKKCIENHNVVGVFTQPDTRSGRGKKLNKSHVKILAEEHELKVFQPDRIRNSENIEIIKELNPDIMVVIAYGQILSQEILDIPKFGCLNIHTSLLPKLRGPAPINWAIINGEKESGVTIQQMDIGIDTGDMLNKKIVNIEKLNAGEFHDILMVEGAELLNETLIQVENGTLKPEKQDHSKHTYAPKLSRDMAVIDWNKTSREIYNFVRGLNPWPVAHTSINDKKVKVFECEIIANEDLKEAGTVLNVDKQGILVKAKENAILIKSLQVGNKKRMDVASYIAGNKDIVEGIEFAKKS